MASRASPADEDEDEEEINMRLQARVAAVQCLSAGEAAKMLEGMQVDEAARLVAAMSSEQRGVALLDVDDDHRAAVIAAMPAETAVLVMNELSKAVPEAAEEASATPEAAGSSAEGTSKSGAVAVEGDEPNSEMEEVVDHEKQESASESMESPSVGTVPAEAAAEEAVEEASSEAARLEPEQSVPKTDKVEADGETNLAEDADHTQQAAPANENEVLQPEDSIESMGDEASAEASLEQEREHMPAASESQGVTSEEHRVVEEDTTAPFSPPPRTVGMAATSQSEDDAAEEAPAAPAREQVETEAESDEVVVESSAPISNQLNRPGRAVVREGSGMDSLSTQEAAEVLARVPPFEAARLALSMDEEERMAALAHMPDRARKVVLGALPYDIRLAAGFIDADLEDDMVEYNSDSDEEMLLPEDIEGGPMRYNSWDNDDETRGTYPKGSAVSAIGQRAMGAAGSAKEQMRQGYKKAAKLASERAQTSKMPAKVVLHVDKAKDAASTAASTAAGMARQGLERAKTSEFGGKASEISGKAVASASELSGKAVASASELSGKAKEKVAVAADTAKAAADTAKAKLSSAKDGLVSFMQKKNTRSQRAGTM